MATRDYTPADRDISLAGFLGEYPAYADTFELDDVRAADYARLDRLGHVYLDFTGGGLLTSCMLVVPSPEYLYYVEGMAPTVTQWVDKDGNIHGKVREIIAPVIAHSGSLCEITGITSG